MIFQIICMFPDIQREYRVETECERIVLIRKSHDGGRAVRTDNQPRAAGSELSKGGRLHVREKLPAGVIVFQDGRSNFLSRRGHEIKVKVMAVHTAPIVAYRSTKRIRNVF